MLRHIICIIVNFLLLKVFSNLSLSAVCNAGWGAVFMRLLLYKELIIMSNSFQNHFH